MPKKQRKNGVRGPNSALTEFLRNEGITDAFRERQNRSRSPRTQSPATESPGQTPATETPEEAPEIIELDSEEEIVAAARRKRNAVDSSDDDYESAEESLGNNYKAFGENETCVECGNPFKLSVYSRRVDAKDGYLCEDCNEKLKVKERNARRNELSARKKRRKMAQALLDKRTVKIASLQDICIREITTHIDDVDVLGDIGQDNINKISRILSKNRSLNDATVPLFLNPDLTELEFWDCLNVSSVSLGKIASYCLKLKALTLFMCGQLHNDNLEYYAEKLPNLTKLSLNGPFLISDQKWKLYFLTTTSKLTHFEVRNTHRFGPAALLGLLEKMGPHLQLLKLSRLDGLATWEIYNTIPELLTSTALTHLEISYPYKEEIVTDDLITHILAVAGESLTLLNVDGCSHLTDLFLTEGVAKFCPQLKHLSMRNLHLVTDEGFKTALEELRQLNNGGFVTVDLTKCIGLGDASIFHLLKHSGHTLVDLTLNSVNQLSKEFLTQVFTEDSDSSKMLLKKAIDEGLSEQDRRYFEQVALPLLTRLDMGFVRKVDDEVAGKISEACPKLAILEVYGNNLCTSRARVRADLLLIGRQGDVA